jgi:hypothetical protein
MPTKTKTTVNNIAVVVTTKRKGVFFGYTQPTAGEVPETLRLEQARMCISWSSDIRGVLGLAAKGPSAKCRIGFAVPAITLNDLTSIIECSEESVKQWEKEPWA